MGFEAYRVELRGGGARYKEADAAIRNLSHIKPDPHAIPLQGSTFYIREDGQHVIELELMDSPVRISCRFTLCHPSSVDSAFLDLVRELMLRLGMEAKICEDVRPEQTHFFPLAEFAEFSEITLRSIAARRAEWIGAFGNQPLAATTNEVFERVILPRCQPGIEQPT